MSAITFGEYLAEIRQQRGYTIRHIASLLEISPSYYNDVEKGRRNPLDLNRLTRLAQIAGLTDGERNRLFDLAGNACGRIAPDLADYLCRREDVRDALRAARDLQADRHDWAQFVDMLRQRRR